MAENEIPQSLYVPSLGKRLLLWFGIYFGAQVPLHIYISSFYLFPVGLFEMFDHLSLLQVLSVGEGLAAFIFLIVPYLFYFGHLILSLSIRSKRGFFVLMAILIIAVCLNLYGCNEIMTRLGQIKG
jgi:hypothetical protein